MSKRVSIVLAVLLVVALAFFATGCGSNSPKGVVNTFFESIADQDADKFLKCFEKDVQEDFEDLDDDEIESMLESIDNMFEDEYGKKWVKEFKVTDTEKGDTDDGVTEYTVTVEFEDDDEDIDVIKVKGKYYIDESFASAFGF